MSRKPGFRAGAVAVAVAVAIALTMVLALAAAAIAAGGVAPQLLSPNHKHVAPGHIRLVVGIPLPAAKNGVFVTIANKRKLDKFGHLKECGINRCDFVGPKHWKGSKYSYVALRLHGVLGRDPGQVLLAGALLHEGRHGRVLERHRLVRREVRLRAGRRP